jgi:hypothetical protein
MEDAADWELPFCAICGNGFSSQTDRVWVKAELNHTGGEDAADEYVLHSNCWDRLTEGWIHPP